MSILTKAARTYVVLLLAATSIALFAALALLLRSIFISATTLEDRVPLLWTMSLILALPTAFLAKERNVWKNEFAACPFMLRMIAVGIIISVVTITLYADFVGNWNGDLYFMLAVPCAFCALHSCVLLGVLYGEWDNNLMKRVAASVIVCTVIYIIFLLHHTNFATYRWE